MSRIVLATFFCLATALPAAAQNASATARMGSGQMVTVTAVRIAGQPARIEIATPSGTQHFDGVGEQFLPIKSGGKDSFIVVADMNGDGIDEIVVRGSVTSDASALIAYQWSGARREYLQVDFTGENEDEGKPFLFVSPESSVTVNRGLIEVGTVRINQSGRTNTFVERYRWEGNGFKHAADN